MHTAIAPNSKSAESYWHYRTLNCVIHSSFPFLSQKAWHDPPLQTARQNLLSTSWTNDTTMSCAPVIPHTRCMHDPPKATHGVYQSSPKHGNLPVHTLIPRYQTATMQNLPKISSPNSCAHLKESNAANQLGGPTRQRLLQ